MRLFLCVSCVLGFAGLLTMKAEGSSTTPVPTSSSSGLTSPSTVMQTSPTVSTETTLPTTGLPTAGHTSSNPHPSVLQASSTSVPALTSSASDPGSHSSPISGSTVSIPSETSSTSTSTSMSGPPLSPTTRASISSEAPAVSKSTSVYAIPSGSTTAASMPSPPTHVASVNTDSSKSPGSLVVDRDQSSTVGSSIPGSTAKQTTTAVRSPTPGGPVLPAGSTVSQETMKSTSKGAVTETTSDATTTVKGAEIPEKPSGSTTTTHSSPVESSTATNPATAATVPGEVPRVTSSPSTSQASDSGSSAGPITHNVSGITLTCFQQDLSSTSLILETKEQKAILCNDNIPTEQTKLLSILCETVKPGFKVSDNKDNCAVQLGYNKEQPNRFAVLAVSVQTNAVPEDINKILKGKTEELKKLGFLIDKNSGGEKVPPEEYQDRISIPLIITIVCLAAVLLLVAAIYSCCHQQRRHKKDQRLTEELQTMENGYHDNPTLEVMETSPEMQEKKTGLNGDLGDSWIVPLDNLGKEDLDDDEEDTHL